MSVHSETNVFHSIFLKSCQGVPNSQIKVGHCLSGLVGRVLNDWYVFVLLLQLLLPLWIIAIIIFILNVYTHIVTSTLLCKYETWDILHLKTNIGF